MNSIPHAVTGGVSTSWYGATDGETLVQVNFIQPFKTIPTLQIALSGFDSAPDWNNWSRVQVSCENVTTTGFTADFSIGLGVGSDVGWVRANWIAFGA